jgi:hypothetical protein
MIIKDKDSSQVARKKEDIFHSGELQYELCD